MTIPTTDHNDSSTTTNRNYDAMSTKELRQLLTLRGYDCSKCIEKSELITAAKELDNTNYDDEAYKLFRELNLQPPPRGGESNTTIRRQYNNLDPIWKHPTDSGGIVYVGNYTAASDLRTLQERDIVAIVNCQDITSCNYFEDRSDMNYHRFVVSKLAVSWNNKDAMTNPLNHGFQETFDFIQRYISNGQSVLIHCLAGAHRAGTVGVAWLMYKTNKKVADAITVAKSCRPIINPFGTLIELLYRLDHQLEQEKEQEISKEQEQKGEVATETTS